MNSDKSGQTLYYSVFQKRMTQSREEKERQVNLRYFYFSSIIIPQK